LHAATSCARPPLRGVSTQGAALEFEHSGDGAGDKLLPRPGRGGFARGNFIRNHADGSKTLADDYELQDKLGEGGCGSVFTATHKRSGDVVAVKKVLKSGVQDEVALQAEIEFLSVTDHPNIVRLYETFEDEDTLYFVMEKCSGGDLWQNVLRCHESGLGFSEAELIEVARQMLLALAYCHAHNIAHRDVKPDNFLYASRSPDAPLKLVDFGVSGVVSSLNPGKRFLTRTAGTDGYIAPEVITCRPYGTAADIFSLGAVLHAAVVGLPPYWNAERQAYTFPGRMRWRLLSSEAQALFARLTDPDAEARPSAAEALQDPWLSGESASGGAPKASLLSAEYVARMRRFSSLSKLQRCMLTSLVALSPCTGEEAEKLQRIFMKADIDCSGEVSTEELVAVAREDGVRDADIQQLVSVLDSSKTGQVSYSEWLAAVASETLVRSRDGARRAFEALDGDGDGKIQASELLEALPGVFGSKELKEELRAFDANSDACIDFDEFVQLLRRKPAQAAQQQQQ